MLQHTRDNQAKFLTALKKISIKWLAKWKEVQSRIPPIDKSTSFLRQYLNENSIR